MVWPLPCSPVPNPSRFFSPLLHLLSSLLVIKLFPSAKPSQRLVCEKLSPILFDNHSLFGSQTTCPFFRETSPNSYSRSSPSEISHCPFTALHHISHNLFYILSFSNDKYHYQLQQLISLRAYHMPSVSETFCYFGFRTSP